MRKVIYLILFSFASSLLTTLWAQPLSLQVRANGDSAEVLVTPEDFAAGKTIEIFALSEGSVSLPFAFNLDGPAGLRAQVSSAPLVKSTDFTLSSEKLFQAVTTDTPLVIRRPRTTGAMVLRAESCDIPPSLLAQLTSIFTSVFGHVPTHEELCALFGGGGLPGGGSGGGGSGTPPGSGIGNQEGDGYVRTAGIIHKNTCDRKIKKYIVRMKIDFSGVTPEIGSQGFTLSASMSAYPYRGGMEASIKPKGEGMFPVPLLLMRSVGNYGNSEKIELYKWKKSKGRRTAKVAVRNYVYYRGLVLTRSTVGGVLRGGKGVFEISNGAAMYSACFNLVVSRQRVNGYPG